MREVLYSERIADTGGLYGGSNLEYFHCWLVENDDVIAIIETETGNIVKIPSKYVKFKNE
jgi:hypothetical protein